MTTLEFLSYLHSLDVKLWADGDRLRCEGPKKVLTPTLRAELAHRKAEIFSYLNSAGEAGRSPQPSIRRSRQGKRLPLSFAQERLWFLSQFEPDSSAYNIRWPVRLRGRLEIGALERGFIEIVRRHEALRTTFSRIEGCPVPVVAPSLPVRIPIIDLSGLPNEEKEVELRRLSREEAWRPFDLAQGPLWRVRLLCLEAEQHVQLFTIHHIISDGWSKNVLWRELSILYNAFKEGRPSPLEELPIQYADYAVWQRKWLQGKVLDLQLEYWREQLKGSPSLLRLPTDRPRPAIQSYRGARQNLELPVGLVKRLKSLSRRERVTLFMLLLAAFKVLLHRYTGQTDILVGTPIAGRGRAETEELIGLFLNTLVLRTELGGNLTFRELLARVQKVALEAYAHQELPFEKLVEELKPERVLSHSPLFQVLLILQNVPRAEHKLASLEIEPEPGIVDSRTTKFDLTLLFTGRSRGMTAILEYSSDLFESETIRRLLRHFEVLLKGIVAGPEKRISELPLLAEAERQQLLVEWNDTATAFPADRCLHKAFEVQAEKSPDAVAVVYEDQQLTYRELNGRANRLAHYLRKMGVGPEVLVGLCVERSLEMVIALLGVLKAGGAYVPLDPGYPKERLEFMIEDAGVEVLLTQERLRGHFSERVPTVVCIDSGWPEIVRENTEDPESGTTAENLAYLIYTSGSTGAPKGVQVTHRGVTNFLRSMQRMPGLAEKDVVLAVTPLSFDIAALELFLPLTVGARMVIMSRDLAVDGPRLRQKLELSNATVMQATPASWRLLTETDWQGKKELKALCGGEALSGELGSKLMARAGSVWNLYGPTEATIWSAIYNLGSVDDRAVTVPIGRPIANTQIYLLDVQMQPVPIGVPAELYIGGMGLARGYFKRPELTAERFIPNPFGMGQRLYKTGDSCRYFPNGNVEFLERLDHQVKIRGFRIELGEIESVLGKHPAVSEAAVIVREVVAGEKRLVAYVVTEEAAPSGGELREFLKAKLPDYMVPATFVFLKALPLTPNGKVDRKALPVPTDQDLASRAAYIAPVTELEHCIAGVWQEILRVKKVGMHDNFFDLGGHSLLLLQVQSRLQSEFGRGVSVIELFQYPTVRLLANHLSREFVPRVSFGQRHDFVKTRQAAMQQRKQHREGYWREKKQRGDSR